MAADSIKGPARSGPTARDGRQRGKRKREVTSGGSGSSRWVVRQEGQHGGTHREHAEWGNGLWRWGGKAFLCLCRTEKSRVCSLCLSPAAVPAPHSQPKFVTPEQDLTQEGKQKV